MKSTERGGGEGGDRGGGILRGGCIALWAGRGWALMGYNGWAQLWAAVAQARRTQRGSACVASCGCVAVASKRALWQRLRACARHPAVLFAVVSVANVSALPRRLRVNVVPVEDMCAIGGRNWKAQWAFEPDCRVTVRWRGVKATDRRCTARTDRW